jgi:prepilin-type N-terminal cleavage/methylation domain-containing protein
MHPNRRGFTLIELLIVVVVIGLLAAIAIPSFWQMRHRAFVASMQSDLRMLATQQELHHANHARYGDATAMADIETSNGVEMTVTFASSAGWAAIATHTGMPDAQCGMFFGDVDPADADPATVAGAVACRLE